MTKILCINMCLVPPIMASTKCCKTRINLFFDTYANNYDILLLNEVWDFMLGCKCNSRLNYLLEKALDYNFVFNYHIPRTTFQLCNNGLIILSKYKILETNNLTFSNTAGLQTVVNNGAIHAKINIKNEIINVIVTHLHAGPFDSRFMNSHDTYLNVVRSQTLELKNFIKDNIKKNETYVVAGDFNIDSINDKESLAYLENNLGTSLMRKLNFPNTYPIPVCGGTDLVDPKFNNKPSCIDHVFSNIDENKIVVTVLDLCVNKKYLSDHAGLEISI